MLVVSASPVHSGPRVILVPMATVAPPPKNHALPAETQLCGGAGGAGKGREGMSPPEQFKHVPGAGTSGCFEALRKQHPPRYPSHSSLAVQVQHEHFSFPQHAARQSSAVVAATDAKLIE